MDAVAETDRCTKVVFDLDDELSGVTVAAQ